MQARHFLIFRAALFLICGIVVLFSVGDTLLSIGGGLVLIAFSYFSLRRIKKAGDKPLYQAPVYATPNKQLQDLKRSLIILCILLPALSIWTIYDLNQLESQATDRVSLWAPVAMLYNLGGYWAAVSTIPLLTVLLLIVGLRKIASVKNDITHKEFHDNIGVTEPTEEQ
jgi:hypothetical protein